jgi:FecR protein
MAIRTGKLGWLMCVLACLTLAIPALADSQARIVRLSSVEGDVEIDRNAGQGWEQAFLNSPITEGTKLWTKDDSRAEVEFEDGSTLRLVPQTRVNFLSLSLRVSGAKVSTVNLDQGILYVNYDGRRDDEFTVNFANETTKLTWPVHFRLTLNEEQAEVAIFRGSLEVNGPSGTVSVERNHSVLFALSDDDSYTVAQNVEEDPSDAWDKQQSEYHDHYASSSSYSQAMPYAYGVSDLNYYGNYTQVPGYGYMWQPYFANAGWDPYSNGAWLWYPGSGYTWVSSYPWGWMPYRYGSWYYVPAYGYMWQPGGWSQWSPVVPVSNPPQRYTNPTPPVAAPGHRPVMVGKPPILVTGNGMPKRVTITPGSAGLGIPRGGVSNLAKAVDKSNGQPLTVHITPPVRVVNEPMSGFTARTGTFSGMGSEVGAPAWHSAPSYGRPTSGSVSSGSHASAPSVHSAPASSAGHSSSPR